jgi:hypothetical protein
VLPEEQRSSVSNNRAEDSAEHANLGSDGRIPDDGELRVAFCNALTVA